MKDSIKVNNVKKQLSIFNSLMAVNMQPEQQKTREAICRDLKQFEKQKKLRLYYPEERG